MNTENNGDRILNINAYQFIAGIIKIFKILLKRWYLILAAGIIGGAFGFAYAYFDKPLYEANLTFSLEESNSSGDLMSLAAEFGLNFGSNKSAIFSGENILSIIKSRNILESVLLQSDSTVTPTVTIADRIIQINKLDEFWAKNKRLDNIHFPVNTKREDLSYLQDSALFLIYKYVLLENISVEKPNKKFNLYEIRFKSLNEAFSKFFVGKLIDQTTQFYVELRTKRSKRTLDILESRVKSMRASAGSAIKSKASISDANLNSAFAQQGAMLQERQLDASAYGSAYAELFKNLEIARYQYLQDVPLLQIIDDVNYPLKKIKKGKLLTAIAFSLFFGVIAVFYILGLRVYKGIKSVQV